MFLFVVDNAGCLSVIDPMKNKPSYRIIYWQSQRGGERKVEVDERNIQP